MKSMLTQYDRDEILKRIQSLSSHSQPAWGKMNVYQMLKHCAMAEEMFLGKKSYKRVLLGRLFGPLALKNMIKDDKSLGKNVRTSPLFVVTDDGEVEEQKARLLSLVAEYANFQQDSITHWFFGKMTREQVGLFSYKHLDHHLRQFNV